MLPKQTLTKTKDSVTLYLQELGRIKLLTAAEEIDLARQIGDSLKLESERVKLTRALKKIPTNDELAKVLDIDPREIKTRLDRGRRAKNQMVQANLRLVVSIAKKYLNRGLSFQDLIQEGSLGLIKATEKFDPEKGYKFSTYAIWWIRQSMSRAISLQSRTIRLPAHICDLINRIKKTTKILSQKLGRTPTELEIATAMEIGVDKLRSISRSARPLVSLDKPIGKEEDSTIGDLIEARDGSTEKKLHQSCLVEDLSMAIENALSPREAKILLLRYGFSDGKEKTLSEVSQVFNLSRERIRQIEAKALDKLRKREFTQVLREYLSPSPA